jgi:hypothetical protein
MFDPLIHGWMPNVRRIGPMLAVRRIAGMSSGGPSPATSESPTIAATKAVVDESIGTPERTPSPARH